MAINISGGTGTQNPRFRVPTVIWRNGVKASQVEQSISSFFCQLFSIFDDFPKCTAELIK